jgi:hypothetical protein
MAYRDSIFWNENESLALSIRIPDYGIDPYLSDILYPAPFSPIPRPIPCLPAGFGTVSYRIIICERDWRDGLWLKERRQQGGQRGGQQEKRDGQPLLLLPY